MAGDDTAVGFLKHPIDGGTEKLLLYSTLGDLVLKSKSLSLGTEAMATMDCDVEHQQYRNGQQFWTITDNFK